MADAREWANTAMTKRPWREDFFVAICANISSHAHDMPSILELGSGPGFLALHLLNALPGSNYVALDFSAAMHALARQRLGDLTTRVQFVEADFRNPDWTAGLPPFDAIVTIQAVHELRHKPRAPSLYREVRSLLRRRGTFLMCDHFVGTDGMSNTALFMTPGAHERALRDAGFSMARKILQKGGLVLFLAEDIEAQ